MGVLDRRERDKNNEIGLKEGRGIEIETTVLPLRDACSLRFVFTYHSILLFQRMDWNKTISSLL